MLTLDPIDSVEVHVLVDNVTDNLSSVPSFVETEFAALGRRQRGMWVLGGSCLCCAAHGLSCLITTRSGSVSRTLLFDTGPEDRVFEQNVSRLGADLAHVDAIVLSHGHWTTAALCFALFSLSDPNGGRPIPYYAHPDMFRTRATKLPDGSMRPMEDVPGIEALTSFGAIVVNTTEPQMLLDGTAYVSGEIARITPFETGLPGQHRRTLDGKDWELDELIMDERFVAVNVRRKGLVVFTACSHAGVVNVLEQARASFPNSSLCRAGRPALVGNERAGDFSDRGGVGQIRSLCDRSRALHGLAGHERACERFRQVEAGTTFRRQALHVLTAAHPADVKTRNF